MAFVTGTATDRFDLWNKLLDFLQNNPDLVAAGQNWTVAWQAPAGAPNMTDIVLKGPGMAGADQVFVGLSRTDNTLTAGESLIWISACTGVLPGANNFLGHINSLSHPPAMFLDSASMKYWFVANGRRFVVVVKMSTVYNAMYGGFFLPYALPEEYGLPLFVGGSRGYTTTSTGNSPQPATWRVATSATDAYRHFIHPASLGNGQADSQGFMLAPDGTWMACTCSPANSYETFMSGPLVPYYPRALMGPRLFPRVFDNLYTDQAGDFFPYYLTQYMMSLGYNDVYSLISPGLDGEVPLHRATLMRGDDDATPDAVTYGVLDGCFAVNGAQQSAENIITINGVDHLIVQNVSRTATNEYWALALE